MLAEFMDKLNEMAAETVSPQKINETAYSITYFMPRTGAMVDVPKPASPLHRKFSDYKDFLEYLASRVDTKSIVDSEGAVKVASDGPCCFIDDDETHSIAYVESPHATNSLKATLKLSFTEAYQWLVDNNGKLFKQAAFVAALKTTLFASLGNGAAALIKLLSELNFTANQQIKANVNQGYSSFDKQVLNEVKGADAIPERISLSIKKYSEFDNAELLEVALIADAQQAGFQIQLIGDMHDAYCRRQFLEMKAGVSQIIPKTYRGKAQ